MTDWTDPEKLLEYVQGIEAKEKQMKLIETERKPRISEAEAKYLDLIARLKAWNDKEAERMRRELEGI